MLNFMFDAGHAGKCNQAPLVPEYFESEMAWKLQGYIVEELKNYKNVRVFTTRDDLNTDVPVFNRGAMAEGMDYFESLHSNATETTKLELGDSNERVNRVDIYCPIDKRNGSHELGLKLATEIAKLMGVSGGHVKTRKYPDRDDLEYYGVIRGAQSVGVPVYLLTEHSFHTNAAAAAWLLKDENLKQLAKLKVEILADWYKLERKSESNKEESKQEAPDTNANANSEYDVYVVQKGDNLSKIAAKYGTTWQELAEYNELANPNKIYAGQEVKIPKKPENKEENASFAHEVGDIVNFKGSVHYVSANAATSGSKCAPGKAKVTARHNGKHPYHLIAEKDGESNVYGWVDAENVEPWRETETVSKISRGDKVKVKKDVTNFSNGATMRSWVRDAVLYVRDIENDGDILLVSTEPTKKVYTGRVKASDVYKV